MSKNKHLNNKRIKNKENRSWIIVLVITTVILSISMSATSSVITQKINFVVSIFILLCIIILGITFDIIGIAVASANETPFHAMASNKLKGAKNAIKLVKNASKVSTFCNDVIGDVCGVISGSASAFIVLKLTEIFSGIDVALLGIIISAMVAGITVLGKGFGKTVAISNNIQIVYKVALLQYYIMDMLNIKKCLERRDKK